MRVARGALLTVFVALASLSLAAPSSGDAVSQPRTIGPGEMVRAEISTGDAETAPLVFELAVGTSGLLTIEARSIEFDVQMRLARIAGDGTLHNLRQDDDAGIGTDSRLILEAASAGRYRIEIGPSGTWYCGGHLEVAVTVGVVGLPVAAARENAERAYWGSVEVGPTKRNDSECRIDALLRRVKLLRQKARFPEAKDVAVMALALAEQNLAPNHPLVAASLDRFGLVQRDVGAYAEAAALFERAIAIREKTLGPNNPDLAGSLHNLGVLLRLKGKYGEARPMLERALAIREKSLGSDHPDVAGTLNQLGTVFYLTGDYAPAKVLYQRGLAIRERALGPDHPDVASSLIVMANLLSDTVDYLGAKPLYERALAIEEKTFGPLHPEVALALENLGVLLTLMGDYRGSRPMHERALSIREKELGPDHPDVGMSLNNLGNLLRDMGDYAGATRLHRRALAIWQKTLGPEHEDVAGSMLNLAGILTLTGEYVEAMSLLEHANAIWEKVLGPDHPTQALGLGSLAALFEQMGDYARAKPLYKRALAINEKGLGPEHPMVALSLDNMAGVLDNLGEYAGAKQLFDRALAIREKELGPDHPDVAVSLNNLGNLLGHTGDTPGSMRCYQRALAIREKSLGTDHPDVATNLTNLGDLLRGAGNYSQARPFLERALVIRERAFGPEHPLVGASLENVGIMLAHAGETERALQTSLMAESIGTAHLRLTVRGLSENLSLRYAAVRASGLDVLLSISASGLNPGSEGRVFDALIRSRALVFDEMSARHRALSGIEDPGIADLSEQLASASTRLANILVRGLGEMKSEQYRALIQGVRQEKEQVEQALARKSAVYRLALEKTQIGMHEVARALPQGSGVVAFAQYNRHVLPAGRDKDGLAPEDPPRNGKPVPSYLAFVLRAGTGQPIAVPVGSVEEVDALVARWRGEVQGNHLSGLLVGEAEASYRAAGEALRRKVWDPIAVVIGNSERVFVVPDGAINLVSLASLPVGETGYLLDGGPLLHYLSTERDMILASPRTLSGKGLLALGGPAYDETSSFAALTAKGGPLVAEGSIPAAGSGGSMARRSTCGDFRSIRFEPLPASAYETEEVVSLWKRRSGEERGESDPIHLSGAAATEPAFKAHAPGRRILHIATHGFFLEGRCQSALDSSRGVAGLVSTEGNTVPTVLGENPLLLSGLALAGANHRSSAQSGEEDGVLTAEEISVMNLAGVEWAVLSACDTGVGEIKRSEGVLGMRRAFLLSGARTLIMSLWSVDDDATREWMKVLYEGRLLKGLGTAEAIREASLRVLREQRAMKRSTHPFYWAGFVAAGDWR